jgi:hypothetical protein
MRDRLVDIPLAGTVAADAHTGRPVDLGGLMGVRALTLVRHRY